MLAEGCGSGEERGRAEAPPALPVWSASPSASASAAAAPTASASASAQPAPPDPVPRISRAMFPFDLDPTRAKVGWLSSKKAFVYATGARDETTRSSLTLVVASTGAASQRTIDVCTAAACATDAGRSKLDEALRKEGLSEAMVLSPILFPFPPKEVTVGAIAAQVRWVKDHLEIVRKAKVQKLGPVPASDRATATPVSITASPDGSMLVFTYSVGKAGDPNAATKSVVYAVPAP